MQLYPHQEKALEYLNNSHHSYLAMSAGLGKTAVCLSYIKRHNLIRVIVFSESSQTENWRNEVDLWGIDLPTFTYKKELPLKDYPNGIVFMNLSLIHI